MKGDFGKCGGNREYAYRNVPVSTARQNKVVSREVLTKRHYVLE